MAENNKTKKRRKIIVDKKNNVPYHLKHRSSNLLDSPVSKLVIILMILAFIIGPIVGVFIVLKQG